jgi:hypothetical protein
LGGGLQSLTHPNPPPQGGRETDTRMLSLHPFGLLLANMQKTHPLRLPPLLREVGGGGGMKEAHALFFLLHCTSPLQLGSVQDG